MDFYASITTRSGRSPLRKVTDNTEGGSSSDHSSTSSTTTGSSTAKRHKAVHSEDSRNRDTNSSTTSAVAVAAAETITAEPVDASPKEEANELPTAAAATPPLTSIDLPTTLPCRKQVQIVYETIAGQEDQTTEMTNAGLLSLQTVLIPVTAQHQLHALKKIQAKLQRDDKTAHHVQQIQVCRKTVYDCAGDAMAAVRQSRHERRTLDQEREWEWERQREMQQQQAQLQAARALEEKQQQAQRERLARKKELIKKHPRNQALWREVVYLMTEMSKLEKEERLWKEAQENLQRREAEFEAIEQQQQHQANEDDIRTKEETTTPGSAAEEEMEKLEQTIQDITISSTRIQQALDVVSEIAGESDRVRQDLYRRYRRDFQFHGYQGIKDPKGLLRSLSQSQDV